MIGSRARRAGTVGSADPCSDWDFQVITDEPRLFASKEWAVHAGLSKPSVYVIRRGRLGTMNKLSAIFPGGELDLVLIPSHYLRLARRLFRLGLLPLFPAVHRAIAELNMILLSGYRLVKGADGWQRFFQQIISEVAPRRMNDIEICALAEGYICDYVSTHRKIATGELLAAQRWLHVQLAETNYQLFHELKLRGNELSFPDARRIEKLWGPTSYQQLIVSAIPEKVSLFNAVERSAETCRALMASLVGSQWHWPELPPPLPPR
jgi:hypothetical protein